MSTATANTTTVSRAELEDFFFMEAALLDAWQVDEWLALFVEGASYYVPPAGADDGANPATTLFYIADDYHRLCERVKRLNKRTAHAEFPHSRCRRMISNVRILDGDDTCFHATSNFVTWRSKMGQTDTFFGHHHYTLVNTSGAIKIKSKTTYLDADDIREQGKVSIIV